jgi:HAE1 family hydrophobic/amphiphilic exporter-1
MVRLQDRVATLLREDPSVWTVSSFNGGSGAQNTGRMFINLKPRGRAPADEAGDRGLRRKLREVPASAVYMRPIQNLQLGGRQSKAQYQYILQSVQAASSTTGRRSCRKAARRHAVRDVTSDSQLRGLQASLKIDRDRANTLGVSIDAVRTALFSAFGERQVSTIYTPVDSYQVIMEVAPNAKQDESAFNGIYVRSSSGSLVPLSAFASVERTVGPTVHQPRGAAAGRDGVVQPRARARRWATPRRAGTLSRRNPPAAVDHHELRRRRGRCSRARRAARRSSSCRRCS